MKERNRKVDKRVNKSQSMTNRMKFVLIDSILIFSIAFVVSVLIIYSRTTKEHEIQESETVLNSMAGSIRANISNYKDISRLVMLNSEVMKFLRAEEVDAGLINDAKYGVMDVLNVCSSVDSVFIFRNDKNYMNTGRGEYILDEVLMEDAKWQDKILVLRGGAVVTINGNDAIYRRNGETIISIGRAIYDIDTQKRTGLLQLNISADMLVPIAFDHQSTDVCILTDTGIYLAGNENLADYFSEDYLSKDIVHEMKKYGKTRAIISGTRVDNLPLIVMCASKPQATAIPFETTVGLLVLLVSFALSMGLAVLFVTNNITEPINELSSAIEETKKAGYLKKIDVHMPQNELGVLAEDYNGMIEHLNSLFEEVIDKEKSIQKAEMRVLHEQLKPHFLYNSLETISFMAFDAGAKDVHAALETLGSFYRNFLSKGDRDIPLKTEINIVRDYLSLQKLRYGDIINDEYELDESLQEIKIPKLILQPLVENSIYHGIRLTGEPGIIRVTTKLIDNDLHIYVYDTGVGMSKDIIDEVLKKTPKNEGDKHLGFGLRGTIERIRYYCNNDDVVAIRSEEGEFTEIELTIPNVVVRRSANVQSNAD